MAFTAKLPSFHVPATVWEYQAGTGTWIQNAEALHGQLYTQLRNQDDSSQGTMYFMYPKEDDLLRDRLDYDEGAFTDVLVFEYPAPAPRSIGYRVRDVQPRWLGFPNEHLMATLDKMTDAELQEVITSAVPEVFQWNQNGPTDGTCDFCGELGPLSMNPLTLVTNLATIKRWESAVVPSTCYPEGVVWSVDYFTESGNVIGEIASPVGVSIVGYSGVRVDWDYTLAELTLQSSNEDGLCNWTAVVVVGVA